MDPTQPPGGGADLKKLEDELKGMGNTPQTAPVETPNVEVGPSPVNVSPGPTQQTPAPLSNPAPIQPPAAPKSSKTLMIAAVVLVLSLLGFGAYYLFGKTNLSEPAPTPYIVVTPIPTETSSPTPEVSPTATGSAFPSASPSASASASPSASPTTTPSASPQ